MTLFESPDTLQNTRIFLRFLRGIWANFRVAFRIFSKVFRINFGGVPELSLQKTLLIPEVSEFISKIKSEGTKLIPKVGSEVAKLISKAPSEVLK